METSIVFSINRVIIVGRLTRDPDLRALPSGSSVCDLRIACNSYKREANGELADRPNYFDVSVYGAPGENVANYMRKGYRVAIDGRLSWREWEAEDQKRQAVSIVADTVQFLDRPGDRNGSEPHDGDAGELLGVGAGGEIEDAGF
jgi:single-strand DNA-binding protein